MSASSMTKKDEMERAYGVILASIKLLTAFAVDDDCDPENREIPDSVKNPFVKGCLLNAIEMAAEVLVQGGRNERV